MIALVINERTWSIIQWPVLVFGASYLLAFCVAFFLVARKLLRRWRALWRTPHRRLATLEVLGAGVVLTTWYFASRVVP